MKKALVIIPAIVLFAGISAFAIGTAVSATKTDQQEIKAGNEQLVYSSEEDAQKDIYKEFREATEKYYDCLQEDGSYDGSEFAASERAVDAYSMAFEDMAQSVLDIAKDCGNIPQERKLEDYYSDRGLYYDFLVECCRVYKDCDTSLSVEDEALIRTFLREAYYPLESEEGSPAISDFEAVRARRDNAMTAIESLGIKPTKNRRG